MKIIHEYIRGVISLADFLVFGLLWFAIGSLSVLALRPDPPRLVGYGCSGTSGTIFANNEDDFPSCIEIKRY